MGCTSSAPTVSEVHANSTEDVSINEQNEDEEKKLYKNEDAIKNGNELLKSNTENNIQLNENNSFDTTNSSNHETNQNKEYQTADVNASDANNEHQDEDNLEVNNDEKISTLEEVIDHVLSTKTYQKQPSLEEVSCKSEHNETIERETEKHVENLKTTNKENKETQEIKEELMENEVQESTSPSQSECSRATRWEALADMAAELPPSLTIDPITGHIYALSK